MNKRQASKYMTEIGRKGGKIGGKRRLVTMNPEERSRIASIAAKARWKKHRISIIHAVRVSKKAEIGATAFRRFILRFC